MIIICEKVIVTNDDSMKDIYEEQLTENVGWTRKEDINSVIYERTQWIADNKGTRKETE